MDVIFAHRGASFDAPENTLPAFELALQQGSKAIEFDVHLTKDGEIVVCHDDEIQRTTDGTGYIFEQTLDELKERDAGSWFAPEFAGTKIPTLDEVLQKCSKDIFINIEIKNVPIFHQGIEEKIIEKLHSYQYIDNVVISSFDHTALLRVQQLEPKLKLGILFGDHLVEPWNYVKSTGIKAYSVHPIFTFVTKEWVEKFHHMGMKIFAYTVDDRKYYEMLDQIGIDGIFTNIPARFK